MTQAPLMIQRLRRIPVPLADCFACYLRLKPNEYIHSDALIAPITNIEMLQGTGFNEVGDIQRITFKGGAVIEEDLLVMMRKTLVNLTQIITLRALQAGRKSSA